jgi:hypothetical protein
MLVVCVVMFKCMFGYVVYHGCQYSVLDVVHETLFYALISFNIVL